MASFPLRQFATRLGLAVLLDMVAGIVLANIYPRWAGIALGVPVGFYIGWRMFRGRWWE